MMKWGLPGLALAVSGLCGCGAAYDRFAQGTERSYAVSYDADARSGSLSVTFRPVAGSGAGAPPHPVHAMDDATIARLERLVMAAARRNAPVPVEPELPAFGAPAKGVIPAEARP